MDERDYIEAIRLKKLVRDLLRKPASMKDMEPPEVLGNSCLPTLPLTVREQIQSSKPRPEDVIPNALVAADLLEEMGYLEEACLLSTTASTTFLPIARAACLASLEKTPHVASFRPFIQIFEEEIGALGRTWMEAWTKRQQNTERLRCSLEVAQARLSPPVDAYKIARELVYAFDPSFERWPLKGATSVLRLLPTFMYRKDGLGNTIFNDEPFEG